MIALPWDEYVGDPMTADELDSLGPFTIVERFGS